MTVKIYEADSHQIEFEAVVLQCKKLEERFEIILDQTCFFPEGGGQPSDRGTLGEATVLDVRENSGVVVHLTDREIEEGSTIKGRVDWERRFSNMQQHSGEHILSGIINSRCGLDNVGFHIGSEYVTLDFNGVITEDKLYEAEMLANEAIYRNLPVETVVPDKQELEQLVYRSKKELEGPIRIVTIPGCDRCACCGTHVLRTGEIGIIKIIAAQKYKGGTRVSILCGKRALEHIGEKLKSVDEISVLLSARPDRVAEAVGQLQSENSRLKLQRNVLRGKLFEEKAAKVEEGCALFTGFEDDLTPEDLREFALVICQKAKSCAVFSGSDAEGYKYAIATAVSDARQIAKQLNAALNGRGGGSQQLAQGSVICKAADIKEWIRTSLAPVSQ